MAAIGTIRNKFGWLLIGLMIVSLIAFILMGSDSSGGGNVQVQDDLALVDGNALKNSEFSDRVSINMNNYRQQSGQVQLSDEDVNAIRNTTYNQMVTEALYKKIYAKNGIAVSNEEFRDMTTGSRIHPGISNSFQDESGNFDLDGFKQFISTLDLENAPTDEPGTKRKSWKSFEDAIVNERLTAKYNTLIEKSLTVPTFMAKNEFNNSNVQASFDYVKIPFSTIADSTLNLKDSDLKSFMAKNAKKYEKDASVDLKLVAFNIVPSENDKVDAEKWMAKKMEEWKTKKNDSSFISLYSDQAFDAAYYGRDELVSIFKDSIFDAPVGTIMPFQKTSNSFEAAKLVDRKMIPDSLKARHLLISTENVASQEEAFALYAKRDSLFNLINVEGYKLADLTAQNSDDASNATNGGDLNWVKPGAMVKPFNDLIFFKMNEGDVKMVNTQFGLHIVEVYQSKPTKEAVKIATLKKEIVPSAKTQEKTYAQASIFAGNNNTKEKFLAAEENTSVNNAFGITKSDNSLTGVFGNARTIVQWAFKAEAGEVSTPFSIGDAYYVALLVNKNEKGLPNVSDNNRLALQVAAAKAKKGEMLKAKISGTDLNSIASANGTTVATAANTSFTNVNVAAYPEPKVVGVALGMEEGQTSAPIVGEDGVYVITVSTKTAAQEDASVYDSMKQNLRSQYKNTVATKLDESIRKAANIVDNRLDFF